MSQKTDNAVKAQGAKTAQNEVVANTVANANASANYRFALPLTDEEKARVIAILESPEYKFVDGEASFQIKKTDVHTEKTTDKGGLQIVLSFEEKVAKETELRKVLLEIAKNGLADAVTVAFGFCWNDKPRFNEVRDLVRKYRKNDEYDYYRENDATIALISDAITRIKYSQNYLKPRLTEKRSTFRINGELYTIPEKLFVELKKQYADDKEGLRTALLANSKPAKESTIEEF